MPIPAASGANRASAVPGVVREDITSDTTAQFYDVRSPTGETVLARRRLTTTLGVATYDLLGYISFFTVGEDECRAWSIPKGTVAQLAAGEIHTDIARGFIRAEVVSYDALMARGSMHACKEHGEARLEGKEYVVQDGDIVNFRFAT